MFAYASVVGVEMVSESKKRKKNKITRHLYLSVKMYEIYYPSMAIPLYMQCLMYIYIIQYKYM